MPDYAQAVPPSLLMTSLFVLALTSGLIMRFWLSSRQIRCVSMHRGHVPDAFATTVSLKAHQKAADYTITKARLGLLELILGAVVALGWTLLGGLSTLNAMLLNVIDPGLAQQLSLLVAFIVIGGLIELPISWYQTFVVEARFGFNKASPQLWLTDLLKSVIVAAMIGLPLATLVLWVMGATGHLWWLWTWAVWMGFNLLLLVIYPTLIAPIFNKFSPLEDENLKAQVSTLMKRCGFAAKGLYVMDGSKRSAHANAYFTGFGTAKRVVFYDTLLAKLTAAEVDAVLAHELGHFRHRHVLKRVGLMFSMSLIGLAALGWVSSQTWFYAGLGVQPNLDGPNDALALLLFVMVIPVFSFFISPLFTQLSRRHEFEADAYAIQQTSSADLTSALLKLYEDNASTLTPDPIYVKFYYSHPPASERLSRITA